MQKIKKCPKCGRPLVEIEFYVGDFKHTHILPCECQKEAQRERKRQEDARERAQLISDLGASSHMSSEQRRCRFVKDDKAAPKITKTCTRYVTRWYKIAAENIGMLFFGGVGTGKTFMACAIANALIANAISAKVYSVSEATAKLRAGRDNLDDILNCSLLVLDDLGSESDTPYGIELLYTIINARLEQKRPIIVTTNLSPRDLSEPKNLTYARIYDRLLAMCPVQIKFEGESRRKGIADKRVALAKELLRGDGDE